MKNISQLESSKNIEVDNWRIFVLEVEETLIELGKGINSLWPKITEVKGMENGLHNKQRIRRDIRSRITASDGKILTCIDDNLSHHYTYGLCREVADKRSDEYCYFHFDTHVDFFSPQRKYWVAAGGFVEMIMRDSNAKALRYIGCRSLKRTFEIISQRIKNFQYVTSLENIDDLEPLMENTPNDAYVSIDLDVLGGDDIMSTRCLTDGPLSLDMLLESLRVINQYKNIISADICGYRKTDDVERDQRTLGAFAKITETITGYKP